MDKFSIACVVVGALIIIGCTAAISLPAAGIVAGSMVFLAGVPWGDI